MGLSRENGAWSCGDSVKGVDLFLGVCLALTWSRKMVPVFIQNNLGVAPDQSSDKRPAFVIY